MTSPTIAYAFDMAVNAAVRTAESLSLIKAAIIGIVFVGG